MVVRSTRDPQGTDSITAPSIPATHTPETTVETRQPGAPSSDTRAATGPVRIRLALDQDADRWNAFVATAPDGNFYQRYEWQQVNHQLLGHPALSLMAERDDRVVGVLPLVHVRSRLFGSILSSMPFVNLGGPAAEDPAVEELLVSDACRRAEAMGCDYMEIRTNRALGDLVAVSTKVSMTVPLDGGADVVWEGFSRKHRKNVRRAQQEDLEIRSGGMELLDPFYHLMERSWRALGTPLYRKDYFAGILERFGSDILLFVAYHEGAPVATALNGLFGDTVEGIWAAVDPAHRKLQPNYVLYWAMIQHVAESGFRRFHLGRSTADSGAAQFKARWNAAPEPLFWNYHLVGAGELPNLNPDNPRYDLAIRAWRKLPLVVTRAVGPHLARLIP
jgi:FemAB-related protein (PEP-CTERM system-associated)